MTTDFNQLVLAEISDGIIVCNPDGIVAHWAKGAERLFGFSPEEAVGSRLGDLIFPENRRNEGDRIMQQVQSAGSYTHESLCRKKDG